MSKDAEAQRQVCRNLVNDAINRNNKFVDRTLQLSNLSAITGYLLGSSSKDGSSGPVSKSWDTEVVAGTFDQLAKQVCCSMMKQYNVTHLANCLCTYVSHF